jgi:hypothetical protein
VVDADASVSSVDEAGVHLRHDRQQLLARQMRPPETKSSHQVAAGEDVGSLHRGDEDSRPLDSDDVRGEQDVQQGQHTGFTPMSPGG